MQYSLFQKGQNHPPQRGGAGKLAHPRCRGDSKNSFATGVTERQKFQKRLFFSTSTDAMWAGCPGHHCKEGDTT